MFNLEDKPDAFALRCVKLCDLLDQVRSYEESPTVWLAFSSKEIINFHTHLENGLEMFDDVCEFMKNEIIENKAKLKKEKK